MNRGETLSTKNKNKKKTHFKINTVVSQGSLLEPLRYLSIIFNSEHVNDVDSYTIAENPALICSIAEVTEYSIALQNAVKLIYMKIENKPP